MGVQPGQEWWTATEKLVNPPLLGVVQNHEAQPSVWYLVAHPT